MRRALFFLLAAMLLTSGATLAAGTKGSLKGRVVDDQGQPLPGVTVTAESPTQLGGAQVAVTGADGRFDLPALDPGFFTVRAELDGFVTQEIQEVQVRATRLTEIDFELPSAEVGSEVITVTAEAAVIDPEQVSVSQTYTEKYLQTSAVGGGNRSYQAVLSQAAGVGGTNPKVNANPSVLGSTAGENAWYVDGFNTTDPVTATFSGNYSFDIIQEISFQTGGFEAEFGNATGGVVNVITKSGGNRVSGSLDVRYTDNSLYESGEFFDKDEQEEKELRPSATLGGPIQKDRLWYFFNYQPTETERTAPGSPTTRVFEGDYFFGKLSWQMNPSWRLVLKGNGDPTEIQNASFGTAERRPPETQRLQEQGGDLFQLDASGVLSSELLLDLRGGISRRDLNSFPMSGDLETPGQENVTTGLFSVNFQNAQFSDRDRDFLNGSLTYFADDWRGAHELKTGFELNDTFFSSQNYITGNYDITRRTVNGNDILRNYTFDPNRDVTDFDGQQVSIYAQDAWNLTDTLTLKLGARYDQAEFENNLGETTADLDKLQPRVGLAWDVTGDGKTIARASWGRFMHPSALTSASFNTRGADIQPTVVAWSCNYVRQFTFGLPADDPTSCAELATVVQGAFGWEGSIVSGPTHPAAIDPEGWIVGNITGGEGAPNLVDPNLEATYQDSLIFGVERSVGRRTSVELSYVDKETFDIFEDTCNGNLPTPVEGHACDFYVMTNLADLKREYQGVLLRFESRAIDGLHLASSLTWSESKGNQEYNQNSGSDYDFFPDHFVNRFGLLNDHRRWRFKVNGYVDLPADFTLGFDAYWSSNAVYDILAPAETAGYGDEYVEPRGAGEGEENYALDLQVVKTFDIANVRLQLIGVIVNVFDNELAEDYCEDIDGCASILGDPVDLGEPIDWVQPRSYELGVRIDF